MDDKADTDKVVFNPIKEISYQLLDEAIQLVTPPAGETYATNRDRRVKGKLKLYGENV